jgi:hypothetical protein
MATLAQILENRKNLEKCSKAKHDTRFDDLERRANQHLLIVAAILVAAAYAVSIDIYYRTKYTVALEGEIKAKSEMTKAEVKALNIAQVKPEKRK